MNQQEHNLQVDYIEFPAIDIEATKRFYSHIFGWQFKAWGPDYISFNDGRLGGGFSRESQSAGADRGAKTRGVLVVIYATSLDEIYRKVKEAGGKVARETFDFPGGRRFHFIDPNGNELAVWSE